MNFVILFIYLFAAIFLFWEVTNFIIKFRSFSKFILFLVLGLLFILKMGFAFFLVDFPPIFEYMSFGVLVFIIVSIFYMKSCEGVRQ